MYILSAVVKSENSLVKVMNHYQLYHKLYLQHAERFKNGVSITAIQVILPDFVQMNTIPNKRSDGWPPKLRCNQVKTFGICSNTAVK